MHYEERQHTIADTEYAVSQHDEEAPKMFFVDVHKDTGVIDPMRKNQLLDTNLAGAPRKRDERASRECVFDRC
jgi:hypothetical protein